jgi:hypothetical protein
VTRGMCYSPVFLRVTIMYTTCRSGDTWDVLLTCVPKGNNNVYNFHLEIQNIYSVKSLLIVGL